MFETKEPFSYLLCSSCNCLQLTTSGFDIAKHYPDNYYSYQSPNFLKRQLMKWRDSYTLTQKGFIGKHIAKRFPNHALESLARLSPKKSTRILDIGCGSGTLLETLETLGFSELSGIDPYNSRDLTIGKRVKVLKRSISEIDGKWDIIMMHHSFEHMDSPKQTLNSIRERLSDDGTCIIRIPTTSSYAWKRFQQNWAQIDAPRHTFLHSKESLAKLCKETGLKLYNTVYDSSTFQFWGSIQYERGIGLNNERSYAVNKRSSGFSRKQIKEFQEKSAQLNSTNQGDQAAFYLKTQ